MLSHSYLVNTADTATTTRPAELPAGLKMTLTDILIELRLIISRQSSSCEITQSSAWLTPSSNKAMMESFNEDNTK